MGSFTKRITSKKKLCTKCGINPCKEEITVTEIIAKQHLCNECWDKHLEYVNSGEVEQRAQAQYDKMMRDLQGGMDPMEAWDRKDEKDG